MSTPSLDDLAQQLTRRVAALTGIQVVAYELHPARGAITVRFPGRGHDFGVVVDTQHLDKPGGIDLVAARIARTITPENGAPTMTDTASSAPAPSPEAIATAQQGLRDYVVAMIKPGRGELYPHDFVEGFRHAADMLDAYLAGDPQEPVREAARGLQARRAALTPGAGR